MAEQTPTKQRSPWWFSLRDVLWLIALIGLGMAWWNDHRRLASRVDLYQLQVEKLKEARGLSAGVRIEEPKSRFTAVSEFVHFVETGTDFSSLQTESLRFAKKWDAADAVPGLVALLSHESPDVRRRAAMSLLYVKQRPDFATPVLIKLLDDTALPEREQGDSVRYYAAYTLAEYKAVEALPKLHELMMDDDCEIASQAARMIHRIDPEVEIGPRLIELCKNKDRGNRWYAVHDLRHHVDAKTATLVLTEMFEATDPSDKMMREFIAAQMNHVAESGK